MRPIDADALKEHIQSYTGMFTDEGFMVNLEAILRGVDFQPTLDDLRPKGRWVHKRSIYDSNIYICSNCKEQISILGNKLPSCPYCIADMRARTEE